MKTRLLQGSIMRAAVLALCTAAIGAAPMLAQDNTPAPPSQQQNGMGPGMMGPGMMGHGRRSGRRLAMLTKRLNLTPDQVTQVKAIDADTMSQMKALREDTTTSRADKRSKMMEIHQASQDKIRNVLTDEQKTKYDEMIATMQARRQNRQGGKGGPPPPPPPQ